MVLSSAMVKNGEKTDSTFDAFVAGTLDKGSIQDRQLCEYGHQPDTVSRYAPIYKIRDTLHDQVQQLSIDAAALSIYLGEAALYGFTRAGSNVLVPIQSCRNMYLSTAWGCFDVDVDAACGLVQEYVAEQSWFPVHVLAGWNFERTHEMVRAFNFKNTQRQDPDFRSLMFNGQDGFFAELAQQNWADSVCPLGGSKYSK